MEIVELAKAGTNPDQALRAAIHAPGSEASQKLEIGDIFHITGQPEDVKWRVIRILNKAQTPPPA